MNQNDRCRRRKQIADAVRGDGDPAAVALKFGVSLGAVYASCIEHKVALPHKRRGLAQRFNPFAALKDLLDGQTMAACGIKHGVTRARIGQIAMQAREGGWKELKEIAQENKQRAAARARLATTTPTDLTKKRCLTCERGAAPMTDEEAQSLLLSVPEWKLSADRKRICREWRVRDFMTALDFFQRIAQIAEAEDHHPDLHVTDYRKVAIEIWTHAVGGLTENDFILAAKIDQLPVELKR